MDYPVLSKFWMFIAKKYSTFNEFIFFSEYSVLLRALEAMVFDALMLIEPYFEAFRYKMIFFFFLSSKSKFGEGVPVTLPPGFTKELLMCNAIKFECLKYQMYVHV